MVETNNYYSAMSPKFQGSNPYRVRILGSSGHAKVVASVIKTLGLEIDAFYDDKQYLWGCEFFGSTVAGPISQSCLNKHDSKFIVAIGTNSDRKNICSQYSNLEWLTAISPFSTVDCTAHVDEGSIIMPGSIIQPEVIIGKHCIINTRSSIDHECRLDSYSQIAPGAILCGNVKLGQCSYVGAGAVVKQGIRIGENVMIGAGSVVVKDIESNTLVHGNPAITVKQGIFV